MNKWLEILIGLIILNGTILLGWYSSEFGSFWNFKHAAWEFFKGGLVWIILMIGLLLIILGINDIKE
jgi:hypothetical protein